MATKRKGPVIRVSHDVERFLTRHRRKKESFDAILRRYFGLPDKRGNPQDLRTYFVIPNDDKPIVFTEEPDARGFAIQLAIRQNRKKTERAIEVREVP